MKWENHSIKLGEKARRIMHKNIKEPVLHTAASYPNGNTYKYNSEARMAPEMGQLNLIQHQYYQDTSSMSLPLLDNFGYLEKENCLNR